MIFISKLEMMQAVNLNFICDEAGSSNELYAQGHLLLLQVLEELSFPTFISWRLSPHTSPPLNLHNHSLPTRMLWRFTI